MPEARVGYEEHVGRYRAKSASGDPERDPAPMVQELIARLQFAAMRVPMSQKNILDYGCGTGLALQWLALHAQPKRAVGLDVSKGAIEFARRQYPGFEFRAAAIEAPQQDLKREFDIALCFEVLEHLKDPDSALAFVAAHYLKPNGLLISSTPNRVVFSAGTEPSPINRTHIHEMLLEEYVDLLGKHFVDSRVWGMRFRDVSRRRAYERMVRHSCDGLRLFGERWWHPLISRCYRWIVRGEIWRLIRGQQFHRWTARDFEFVDHPDEIRRTALWFFAISLQPRVTRKESGRE
jgi:SAM-dependent methyltransferase